MKKIIFIICILLCSGCDYIELNNLSIIKNIGITLEDNEYILYASILDEINEENIPSVKVISIKKETIKECFQELIIRSPKNIYYSHIDLLILGNNLKDNNLEEIFQYFLKNNKFRNDFLTISSSNVEKLIKNTKYNEIEEMIKNNAYSKIIKIDIEEVIKDYLDNNKITLSLFTYDENNLLYKYNIKYQNNQIERISE